MHAAIYINAGQHTVGILITMVFLCFTGVERTGHLPEELAALGLRTFVSAPASNHTKMDEAALVDSKKPSQNTLTQLGSGLAAIPKKLIERIKAGDYFDFMELPPARGKT